MGQLADHATRSWRIERLEQADEGWVAFVTSDRGEHKHSSQMGTPDEALSDVAGEFV